MPDVKSKRGRKPKSEQNQEIAKVVGDVVVDLEPTAKAPVSSSVDPIGEDLGDVTKATVETPVIASGEPVDPEVELQAVLKHKATFEIKGGEFPETPGIEKAAARLAAEIDAEMIAHVKAIVAEREEAFTPILVPTMVGDAQTGHIPCPKAVWELVQIEGWQDSISDHPAHVQLGLKSVLHWQKINGTAKVRCQSSSRFAVAV